MEVKGLNVHFGDKHVLKDISMDLNENEITAIIGPSGCGKSTFIRCLNRMNDFIPSAKVEGKVTLDGMDIYEASVDVTKIQYKDRHGIPTS